MEDDGVSLSGQVGLVTGAARGIGRAIAVQLAADGADVAVADVREDALAETVSLIEAKGRRGLALKVDVTAKAEVDAMVEKMYASNQHDLWEEAMMTMDIKTMTQLERQFPGIDWGRQSNMDMLDDHGEQAGNAYEAFRTYTRKALGRLTTSRETRHTQCSIFPC